MRFWLRASSTLKQWLPLGTAVNAPSASPASMTYELNDPQQLDQLSRDHREVVIAVVSLGSNGPDYASVAVDCVELELQYRAR